MRCYCSANCDASRIQRNGSVKTESRVTLVPSLSDDKRTTATSEQRIPMAWSREMGSWKIKGTNRMAGNGYSAVKGTTTDAFRHISVPQITPKPQVYSATHPTRPTQCSIWNSQKSFSRDKRPVQAAHSPLPAKSAWTRPRCDSSKAFEGGRQFPMRAA